MENKPASAQPNKLAELWEELRLVLTGRGSIFDAILPALIFLALNAAFDFNTALWGSLVVAVGFAFYRLFKRQSLLYVLLGLAGAGLTVLLSQSSGLEGYILPDLVTGSLTIFVAIVSVLVKRPMVVGYKVHRLTYQLVTQLRLVKVPYVAMANLLVGSALAPEFLQDRCRADLLAPALLAFLDDPQRVAQVQGEYRRVHEGMRHNAARAAAVAVLELIRGAK